MMSCRSRSNRWPVFLAGCAVQAVLHLGVPVAARAQAQSGISSSGQTQSGANSKSWRLRHPVLFDTLIGTAGGAAVGCALGAAAQSSDDVSCGYLAAPFGLLGAAIGVVPGLITERRNERDPLSLEDLQRRVKPGTRVLVMNAGGDPTAGKVVDVSGDSLTLRSEDGTTTTIANAAATWHLRSDSLKNGILIGAALGAAIAVANYKDGAGAGAITGVPIWALIGALTDRAIRHQRLTMNEPAGHASANVTVSPWLAKRSGGFAVAVGF
jgi:hypothetical protein